MVPKLQIFCPPCCLWLDAALYTILYMQFCGHLHKMARHRLLEKVCPKKCHTTGQYWEQSLMSAVALLNLIEIWICSK